MKKLLILCVILVLAAFAALNLLSKNAPELLRSAVEKALGKRVEIGDIDFRWPGRFILRDFVVYEDAPFASEVCFRVSRLRLEVNPAGLRSKILHIRSVKIEDAEAVLRKKAGQSYHFLSSALKPAALTGASASGEAGARQTLPVRIDSILFEDCAFRFADYDIRSEGFALSIEDLSGRLENLSLPMSEQWSVYEITGRLVQGRGVHTAEGRIKGRTRFADAQTDAVLSASGLSLPYFAPYLGRITQATPAEGLLDLETDLSISRKILNANVIVDLAQLHFTSYESGERLFGISAAELLGYLKDSSGRLRFQMPLQWDLRDAAAKPYALIRSAIERSLRELVLGRLGSIIAGKVFKTADLGGETAKNTLDERIEKVKDFFKF